MTVYLQLHIVLVIQLNCYHTGLQYVRFVAPEVSKTESS